MSRVRSRRLRYESPERDYEVVRVPQRPKRRSNVLRREPSLDTFDRRPSGRVVQFYEDPLPRDRSLEDDIRHRDRYGERELPEARTLTSREIDTREIAIEREDRERRRPDQILDYSRSRRETSPVYVPPPPYQLDPLRYSTTVRPRAHSSHRSRDIVGFEDDRRYHYPAHEVPYDTAYYDHFRGARDQRAPSDDLQVDFSPLQQIQNVSEKTASSLMPVISAVVRVCRNVSRTLDLRSNDLQNRARVDEIEATSTELAGFAAVLDHLLELLRETSGLVTSKAFENVNTTLQLCKKGLQKIQSVITTSRQAPSRLRLVNYIRKDTLNASLLRAKPVRLNLDCLKSSLTTMVSTIILADLQAKKLAKEKASNTQGETADNHDPADPNATAMTVYELDAAVTKRTWRLEDDILENARALKVWQREEREEAWSLPQRFSISPASKWVAGLIPFESQSSLQKRISGPVQRRAIANGLTIVEAGSSHVNLDEEQEQARIAAVIKVLLEKWTQIPQSFSQPNNSSETATNTTGLSTINISAGAKPVQTNGDLVVTNGTKQDLPSRTRSQSSQSSSDSTYRRRQRRASNTGKEAAAAAGIIAATKYDRRKQERRERKARRRQEQDVYGGQEPEHNLMPPPTDDLYGNQAGLHAQSSSHLPSPLVHEDTSNATIGAISDPQHPQSPQSPDEKDETQATKKQVAFNETKDVSSSEDGEGITKDGIPILRDSTDHDVWTISTGAANDYEAAVRKGEDANKIEYREHTRPRRRDEPVVIDIARGAKAGDMVSDHGSVPSGLRNFEKTERGEARITEEETLPKANWENDSWIDETPPSPRLDLIPYYQDRYTYPHLPDLYSPPGGFYGGQGNYNREIYGDLDRRAETHMERTRREEMGSRERRRRRDDLDREEIIIRRDERDYSPERWDSRRGDIETEEIIKRPYERDRSSPRRYRVNDTPYRDEIIIDRERSPTRRPKAKNSPPSDDFSIRRDKPENEYLPWDQWNPRGGIEEIVIRGEESEREAPRRRSRGDDAEREVITEREYRPDGEGGPWVSRKITRDVTRDPSSGEEIVREVIVERRYELDDGKVPSPPHARHAFVEQESLDGRLSHRRDSIESLGVIHSPQPKHRQTQALVRREKSLADINEDNVKRIEELEARIEQMARDTFMERTKPASYPLAHGFPPPAPPPHLAEPSYDPETRRTQRTAPAPAPDPPSARVRDRERRRKSRAYEESEEEEEEDEDEEAGSERTYTSYNTDDATKLLEARTRLENVTYRVGLACGMFVVALFIAATLASYLHSGEGESLKSVMMVMQKPIMDTGFVLQDRG